MNRTRGRTHLAPLGAITALLLFVLPLAAHAQGLSWVRRAGGGGPDKGSAIAVNGAGDSYVAGSFANSATFGSGQPSEITLEAAGLLDVFLAKYDAAGSLVWAKRAGGTGTEEALAAAVDFAGNLVVAGRFAGTATFGPGDPNQTTLVSVGGDDVFVAKYTPGGALLWAKRAGGPGDDRALGVAVDGLGNVALTGDFDMLGQGNGTAVFGQGEPNQTVLTSAGNADIFVAKFDTLGALLWAKSAGGNNNLDSGKAIAADAVGNSYVTGSFAGTAVFGLGTATQVVLTAAATSGGTTADIFVAKYAADGTLLWAKRAGGSAGQPDVGNGIAVDTSGNSYVTGVFNGSATFGPGESNQTVLTSAGSSDLFLAKLDLFGNLRWAKRGGGTGSETPLALAVDAAGHSHVAGFFLGSSTFGAGEPNQTSFTSAGGTDVFVATFDGDGALVWARRAGGVDDNRGLAIAVDPLGRTFVAGSFAGAATFGAGDPTQATLDSAGQDDIFIAAFSATLSPSGPLAAAILPSSRSVQVGATATAFATIINAGPTPAVGCTIALASPIPAAFTYQTTDPATNLPTGAPGTPAAIAAGAAQSFVISLTPSAAIPPTDVRFTFACANAAPAAVVSGLATLLFSASGSPVPDVVALAATPAPDAGIVNVPGATGTGVFAVATVNVGAGGGITISADTGGVVLAATPFVCQTDPATGVCISALGASVTVTIGAGATPTFGIFVLGGGIVTFDPAGHRIFVRFTDAGNIVRGATSVAVRTQ